jgi:nicotinamidase-related amidase
MGETVNEAIALHLEHAALVTIDVQRDTLDGAPLEIPGTSAVLAKIGRLAETFRQAGRPIVHMVRLYRADGTNAEPCRRDLVMGDTPVLRPGTSGRLLAPGILPESAVELDDELLLGGGVQLVGVGEVVLYKPRWGAFYGTSLEGHLRSLGVDSLVFVGCNFPNCPRASVYEASERDFRVALVDDAVSGLYDRGRDEMRNIGVNVLATADFLTLAHEVFAAT